MEPGTCLLCRNAVEGRVGNVALILCCLTCATKDINPHPRRRFSSLFISKTKARQECQHQVKSLEILHYALNENPTDGGTPTKLYVRAEVRALKNLTPERELAERELVEKAEHKNKLVQKKVDLERRFRVDLSALDFGVRHFLLGDYLSKLTDTDTTRESVVERFAVLDRVVEIMQLCPEAHPGTVFDFCLENRGVSPKEFQALRENMRTVLRLFGTKILHKLADCEVEKLFKSPLHDVYTEFIQRDSAALIRGHLCQIVDERTMSEIMDHSACQQRIGRGGEELIIAQKLAEFWKEKDDRERRQQKLIAALKFKQLPTRVDMDWCESYLSGELDCDVEEVVGWIDLESLFISNGFNIDWRWDEAVGFFEEYMYDEKLEYNEAIYEAFIMATTLESSDDSDDYDDLDDNDDYEW